VDGGAGGGVSPCAFDGPHGTRVEVRDLFYATPARLKFMKSERAENQAVAEEIKRQAMAHEAVGFTLEIDGRRVLRLPAEPTGDDGRLARLAAVLGRDFEANAILVDQSRTACGCPATRACRPTRAGPPPTSSCSSTAGR
jgi:DNA mismatch repair protein MutL